MAKIKEKFQTKQSSSQSITMKHRSNFLESATNLTQLLKNWVLFSCILHMVLILLCTKPKMWLNMEWQGLIYKNNRDLQSKKILELMQQHAKWFFTIKTMNLFFITLTIQTIKAHFWTRKSLIDFRFTTLLKLVVKLRCLTAKKFSFFQFKPVRTTINIWHFAK